MKALPVIALALLFAPAVRGTTTCVEAYGTCLPVQPIIAGELSSGDIKLWNNVWGIRGHQNDNFQQCLFTAGSQLGWTWTKGTTQPPCCDLGCSFPPCMYQFSFPALNYGVDPWGNDTGAADLPVNVGNLRSLVVSHDITYLPNDDLPGFPGPIYARHSLVYDLFLTTDKPAAGTDVSSTITDEVIIMLRYNPEYPDVEACSSSQSASLEMNAVFDGFSQYHYHSFSPNVIGQNYHQFRRAGGDTTGPLPLNVDLAPFLRYLKQRYGQPDLWLGKVVIGTQLYDHTHGSTTFNTAPSFAVDSCDCPQIAHSTCATGFTQVALSIRESSPGKAKLKVRMLRGPQLQQTDLGDPIGGGTAYSLCLYDESAGLVAGMCLRPGGTCGRDPCWRSLGKDPPDGKGYRWKDSAAAAGITRLICRGGEAGQSKLIVNGRGRNVPSGIPKALQSSAQATVQLHSSDGLCLSATLTDLRKNDPDFYSIR
jgi:hypothetical protein